MDVGVFVRHLVMVYPVGHAFTDHVEDALELHGIGDGRVFFDKDLFDGRLVAARGFAEDGAHDGHGAPGDEFLAFLADDDFEDLHGGFALAGIGREENQAGGIGSFRWERDALFGHFLAEEFIGHLDEDSGTVASVGVGTAGTAMVHLSIHREGFHDDVVRSMALEVGNKAYAA